MYDPFRLLNDVLPDLPVPGSPKAEYRKHHDELGWVNDWFHPEQGALGFGPGGGLGWIGPLGWEFAAVQRGLFAAETGARLPVNGARLSMQLSAEEAAGARAPTSITGWTDHVKGQILGRDGGLGVTRAALEDAFSNPSSITYKPSNYGPTFQFRGKNATVVVNVDGKVVTGWAKNRGGRP